MNITTTIVSGTAKDAVFGDLWLNSTFGTDDGGFVALVLEGFTGCHEVGVGSLAMIKEPSESSETMVLVWVDDEAVWVPIGDWG